LNITDDTLHVFSEAVIRFWNDIPENTFLEDLEKLPNWFTTALGKDKTIKTEIT